MLIDSPVYEVNPRDPWGSPKEHLRIHHPYAQVSKGDACDNFIDPKMLSSLEKRSLKDAFQLIAKVQDLIVGRYQSVAW